MWETVCDGDGAVVTEVFGDLGSPTRGAGMNGSAGETIMSVSLPWSGILNLTLRGNVFLVDDLLNSFSELEIHGSLLAFFRIFLSFSFIGLVKLTCFGLQPKQHSM